MNGFVGLIQSLAPLLALAAACGTPAIPYHAVLEERVDSLDVGLAEDLIEVRIFCAFGIGSCILEFSDGIETDSLRIQLLYSEESPYWICESLRVVTGHENARHIVLQEDRPVRMVDGILTFDLPGPVSVLYVSWIDFFRS
jgi:hypothetical protein